MNVDESIKSLCAAICAQAISDYEYLCKRSITSVKNEALGSFSKNEITKFFRSDWGAFVLSEAGCAYTGNKIEEILKGKNYKKIDAYIAAYTIDGRLVATFKTLPECAQFAGLKSVGDICKCCNGHRKAAGGYVWKYI